MAKKDQQEHIKKTLKNEIWSEIRRKINLIIDFDDLLTYTDMQFCKNQISLTNRIRSEDFYAEKDAFVVLEDTEDEDISIITMNIDNLLSRINHWEIFFFKLKKIFAPWTKKSRLEQHIDTTSSMCANYLLASWLKSGLEEKIFNVNLDGHIETWLRNYYQRQISLLHEICSWQKACEDISEDWQTFLYHQQRMERIKNAGDEDMQKIESFHNSYEKLKNATKLSVSDFLPEGGEE